jgi:hypothetical protein
VKLLRKKARSASSAKYIAIYYLKDSLTSDMVGFLPAGLVSKDTKCGNNIGRVFGEPLPEQLH